MQESSTAATVATFRNAAERQDLAALMGVLAADVVIHSPVSSRLRFEGIDQARELFEVVFGVLREVAYIEDFGDGETRALVYRSRLAGQEIEEAQLLRFDAGGRVCEVRYFIRPFPGLAKVAARLAPALARRRHGRLRASSMAIFSAALALAIAIGDRVGDRLLD